MANSMMSTDISDEDLYCLTDYYPFMMESPNGKMMFGIQMAGHSLDTLVNGKTPVDDEKFKNEAIERHFLFLNGKWPWRIGLNMIWYGTKIWFKNLFHREKT